MAQTFKPTTTCPPITDKYFINYKFGGYSVAISKDAKTGYTLPNCVGLSQGLFREEQGDIKVWSDIGNYFSGNAGTWYGNAKKTKYKTGSTPKLGAVACWGGGYGHVAVVQAIDKDGTITVANSGAFSGVNFELKRIPKPYKLDGLNFQGFIYPAVEFVEVVQSDKKYYHIVKKGETLWALAVRYYGSGYKYKDIMVANSLKSTIINVGQRLYIPNYKGV